MTSLFTILSPLLVQNLQNKIAHIKHWKYADYESNLVPQKVHRFRHVLSLLSSASKFAVNPEPQPQVCYAYLSLHTSLLLYVPCLSLLSLVSASLVSSTLPHRTLRIQKNHGNLLKFEVTALPLWWSFTKQYWIITTMGNGETTQFGCDVQAQTRKTGELQTR